MTTALSKAAGPVPGTAAHEGYRSGEPGYRRIAVALFAAGVATFALLYSTQALLPELARAFSVSAAQSTLSLSLTTAGLGVALLVAGVASELLGRTRLIRCRSIASGVVGARLRRWRRAGTALLVLRLLQGVALAGLPAAATAYLREELHPGTYARAAGLYVGGTALGGMSGRLLTGAVADVAGWRWALAAIALLGLLCAGDRDRSRCRRRATSRPRPRASASWRACSSGAVVRPAGCWRSTGSAPAAWARSWASTT